MYLYILPPPPSPIPCGGQVHIGEFGQEYNEWLCRRADAYHAADSADEVAQDLNDRFDALVESGIKIRDKQGLVSDLGKYAHYTGGMFETPTKGNAEMQFMAGVEMSSASSALPKFSCKDLPSYVLFAFLRAASGDDVTIACMRCFVETGFGLNAGDMARCAIP